MGKSCSTHGERNSYTILIGKPEQKRPIRGPRHRWEDIRLDLTEIGGRVWTGFM